MTSEPAKKLELDLSSYEKLDSFQAGHIRHIHNLVSQLDGQWDRMGGQESLQEYFDSYRYQLATMSYAIAVTHYHRLPAARGILKPLFRRIIHKMLLPDVWAYWYNSSQSGNITDPGRTELRQPFPDPVCKENIMYSGHLVLMTSLYAMLFDDDEFEKPESITFTWAPMFWGLGSQTFKYNTQSLQDVIFKEMEQNKWLGVCCEPNMIFIVCNQYPIIAMRYNDVRHGRTDVDAVVKEYQNAWEKKGMVTDDGMYISWLFQRQDMLIPAHDIGLTAWANAFLNSWNSELVHSLYERQALGYITGKGNNVRLQPGEVAQEIRRMVKEEGADPRDEGLLAKARSLAAEKPVRPGPPSASIPYVLLWLSEVGRKDELQGLLHFLDTHRNPTWEKGGLYYPRDDTPRDEEGNEGAIGTFAGNACAGYARLNVPNGQKIMWDKPWTKDDLASRPWIDGVTLDAGVDCLRATWDDEKSALILTVKTWHGSNTAIQPTATNLPAGQWGVYVNGDLKQTERLDSGGSIKLEVEVGGDELDVVFKRV